MSYQEDFDAGKDFLYETDTHDDSLGRPEHKLLVDVEAFLDKLREAQARGIAYDPIGDRAVLRMHWQRESAVRQARRLGL